MRYLSEAGIAQLFYEQHLDLPQNSQGTISEIETRYYVRDLSRQKKSVVDKDTELNVSLSLEKNSVTS